MHRPFRFEVPPIAASALLRPRLLAPLGRRFDARLVTIEAGAGLGKTTLLAQAAAENRLARAGRDAWVTCEPADASPSTLLGALLVATAGQEDGAPTLERVCEAVWAAAPDQVCIVLDDVHVVDPASPGAALFGELVEALPANGHLVVAGRRLPPLGRARLALYDRVVELGDDDLLLDAAEESELAAARGLAADVLRGAGGWPALVELRTRSGRADAERYAWEEVVAPLAPGLGAAFVLLVALGGADADALAEAAGAGAVDVDALAALPLVSTDGRGGLWPHEIWRDLLRSRLDDDGERARVATARDALVGVVRGRGDHRQALELLAALGRWDDVLDVVVDACNDQRDPPWRDQMDRWRELLPDALADRPEVRYLEAMAERATDPWSPVAARGFADAVRGFAANGDSAKVFAASVRALWTSYLREDLAGFEAAYALGFQLVGEGWPDHPVARVNLAMAADLAGDTAGARALAGTALDIEPRLRHFAPLLSTFGALAAGDATDATTVADAAAAAAAAAPIEPAAGSGWAALAPALVAWAGGDLAAVAASRPVDPGERQSLAERIPALFLRAVVAAHLGDAAAAHAEVDAISHLVPDTAGRPLVAGCRAVAAASAALADHDEAAAVAVLGAGLDGVALTPAGAGRAIRWLPAVPYLLHPPSRLLLDGLDHGAARARVLDACRALLDARAERRITPPALLADPDALLAALPPVLAVELVCHACRADPQSGRAVEAIAALADRVPAPTRRALRELSAKGGPIARAARELLGAVPIPPPQRVRIEVLGPPRLLRDDVEVDDPNWRRHRVRQLLGALVVHRTIRRALLGDLLWPDFDEAGVSANLRMTLSYAQALLEPHRARGDAPWCLQQSAGVLRLRADEHLEIDAWELADRLDEADAAARGGLPSVELAALLAALERWRGDVLIDVAGEGWAEPWREHLRRRVVRAAVRAGDLLVAAGRPAEAVGLAAVAVDADPWSEPAGRLLVAARLAEGDRDGAAAACRDVLRRLDEAGIPPEPATVEQARAAGIA